MVFCVIPKMLLHNLTFPPERACAPRSVYKCGARGGRPTSKQAQPDSAERSATTMGAGNWSCLVRAQSARERESSFPFFGEFESKVYFTYLTKLT